MYQLALKLPFYARWTIAWNETPIFSCATHNTIAVPYSKPSYVSVTCRTCVWKASAQTRVPLHVHARDILRVSYRCNVLYDCVSCSFDIVERTTRPRSRERYAGNNPRLIIARQTFGIPRRRPHCTHNVAIDHEDFGSTIPDACGMRWLPPNVIRQVGAPRGATGMIFYAINVNGRN